MKPSRKRIGEALQLLKSELEALGRFFAVVQTVNARVDASADQTYSVIYQACRRALLIGLAGILSTDQESITLAYVIDLARNHPYDFKIAEPETVKKMAAEANDKLASLGQLELKLRAYRDRRLAHLDRKLINEPDLTNELEISEKECAEVLEQIETSVALFFQTFFGEYVDFKSKRFEFAAELNETLFKTEVIEK